MPSILFIAAHRTDRSPSQRFRFEQYIRYLKKNGFGCHLSNILSERDDKIFYETGNFIQKFLITLKSAFIRLRDARRANDFDIIFVQREAFMTFTTFFEKRFSKSKAKLVFDFDDSIWLLDTSEANKKWEWMKSSKKTAKIISMADMIFAGNIYLADYARQFNSDVRIVPTTVDTVVFKRKQEYINNEKICIGWSGSTTTIKHFKEAVPFLLKIKQKYGNKVCFKVMGDESYENKELDIKGIPWDSSTEVDVISSFDIGIMPLPDDEWVKGKCGLKGLTYMSLEIPTIMSAVGVNTEIIEEGKNGFLATNDEEWINKISLLMESFDLRKTLGSNARKTVEERYSVESQKNNYLLNFSEVLIK